MIKKICYLVLATIYMQTVSGIGEAVPISLIKKILPYDPIIIEAGGQHGEDTKWMSELWPKGKIFTFEPSPESFEIMKNNCKDLNNVQIFKLGLDKKCSIKSFYLAGGASSILKPAKTFNDDYFHSDLENPIEIECLTLDAWCKRNNISKIDFLWLDMEGNELNALYGSEEILKTVKAIYTEVNLQRFWEECVMYEELKNYLESKGFYQIWSDITPNWHGNALFVKN